MEILKQKDERALLLEALAKHHDQDLDVAPYEGYRNSNVLMIRHGYSEFNCAVGTHKKSAPPPTAEAPDDLHTERSRRMRLDHKYIDTPLHEIGEEQARNSARHLIDQNVHTVFVSPLFRTLRTAELLFENHPNKANIKFIVCPEITEGISFSCSFAPNAFSEETKKAFPNFDFSREKDFTYPSLWQIEQLTCPNARREILERLTPYAEAVEQATNEETKTQKQKHLDEAFIDVLDRLYPTFIETHDQLWVRSKIARNILQKYQQTLPEDNNKIVIVSHYILSLFLTSSVRHNAFQDMDGVRSKNGALIPYQFKSID